MTKNTRSRCPTASMTSKDDISSYALSTGLGNARTYAKHMKQLATRQRLCHGKRRPANVGTIRRSIISKPVRQYQCCTLLQASRNTTRIVWRRTLQTTHAATAFEYVTQTRKEPYRTIQTIEAMSYRPSPGQTTIAAMGLRHASPVFEHTEPRTHRMANRG